MQFIFVFLLPVPNWDIPTRSYAKDIQASPMDHANQSERGLCEHCSRKGVHRWITFRIRKESAPIADPYSINHVGSSKQFLFSYGLHK